MEAAEGVVDGKPPRVRWSVLTRRCTRIAERQRARSEVRVRSGGVERVRSDGVRPPDAFPGRVKGSCGACTRTRWKATKISCARAYHQGDASRSISRAMMMNPGSGAG